MADTNFSMQPSSISISSKDPFNTYQRPLPTNDATDKGPYMVLTFNNLIKLAPQRLGPQ